ncbi:MAG: methyltransferase domain-containing protein [Candidatus Omnitrophica bacterium]|nr:methyltransferase domain-containing protein [Candidatus Omnitrophota bacterium]
MKLHLGCGTKKLEGWVNIDSVEACQPDLLHDISQPLPYEDQSADEILAEDVLEHFDKYLRFVVFDEWVRVLKVGGTVTLQVPDFKKILFKYFKFGYDNFVDFIFGENLWESKAYIGHFGNHKWGYSKNTLPAFVELFGVEPITVETKGLNLRLVGEKVRHVTHEELDQIKIYSHANKFGSGSDHVTVGFARERIKEFQNGSTRQIASSHLSYSSFDASNHPGQANEREHVEGPKS